MGSIGSCDEGSHVTEEHECVLFQSLDHTFLSMLQGLPGKYPCCKYGKELPVAVHVQG